MAQLTAMPNVREGDLARERLALEDAIRRIESEYDPVEGLQSASNEVVAVKEEAVVAQSVTMPVDADAGLDASVDSQEQNPSSRKKRSRHRVREDAAAEEADSSFVVDGGSSEAVIADIVPPVVSDGSDAEAQTAENMTTSQSSTLEPFDAVQEPPSDKSSEIKTPAATVFGQALNELSSLGQATSEAAKSARETAFGSLDTASDVSLRIEPSLSPEVPSQDASTLASKSFFDTGKSLDQVLPLDNPLARPPSEKTQKRYTLVAAAVGAILAIVLIALVFILREDRQAMQAPKGDVPAVAAKVTDRLNTEGSFVDGKSSELPSGVRSQPGLASSVLIPVAQRAVLFEEAPDTPEKGRAFVGRVVWKSSMQEGVPYIQADVELPERKLTMVFTLKKNDDMTLPASHMLEMVFQLGADFPHSGIANVPGVLTKSNEAARGAPLAGLSARVTANRFFVALANTANERQINLSQLKEHSWIDFPVLYNNGRRALITIEKGVSGEKVFQDAFKAWQQ